MQKNSPRPSSPWMLGLAAFGVAGIVHAASAADHPPADESAADHQPSRRAAADMASGAETPAPQAAPFASSFDGYRPYRADEPLRSWREVNDEAGRLGGHAGQLEAANPPREGAAHAGH